MGLNQPINFCWPLHKILKIIVKNTHIFAHVHPNLHSTKTGEHDFLKKANNAKECIVQFCVDAHRSEKRIEEFDSKRCCEEKTGKAKFWSKPSLSNKTVKKASWWTSKLRWERKKNKRGDCQNYSFSKRLEWSAPERNYDVVRAVRPRLRSKVEVVFF